jgi:hypothetical protein
MNRIAQHVEKHPMWVMVTLIDPLRSIVVELYKLKNMGMENYWPIISDTIYLIVMSLLSVVVYSLIKNVKEYRIETEKHREYIDLHEKAMPLIQLARAEMTYLKGVRGNVDFTNKVFADHLKAEYETAFLRLKNGLGLKTSETHAILERIYGFDQSMIGVKPDDHS